MNFGNTHFFGLFLLIPVLIGFYVWAFKKRREALRTFAEHHLLSHLIQSVSEKRKVAKTALIVLGVLFLITGLTEPKWGYHWEDVKRRGLDMVVALDVSKSMMAEDIKPNRLEAAKREIKSLMGMLTGDRIGIVAFAGTAFLQCPLTLDYGTAKLFLDYLDVDTIPKGGTDIGGAIRTALHAFEGHEKKHRVLILITDGEDHEAGVMEAVEEAKREGVVIFPIGIGKQEGAPIPVVNEQGQKTFMKGEDGNIVLTKLDSALLQKIALLTGGKKGSIGTGSFPLEEIYRSEVSKMEKKELESTRQKRYEDRFQWFLFLALLCFTLEALLTERKSPARKKESYAAVLLIFLAVTQFGFSDGALWNKIGKGNELYGESKWPEAMTQYNDAQLEAPTQPEIFFNMGNVLYRQGKYTEAIESYRRAMEKGDTALEAKGYFNTGNALFHQGQLREALDAYKMALERAPDDTDAKYNIEYTERKIKEMLSQAKQTAEQAAKEQAKQDQKAGDENKQASAAEGQQAEEKKGDESQNTQAAGASAEPMDKKEGEESKGQSGSEEEKKEEEEKAVSASAEKKDPASEEQKGSAADSKNKSAGEPSSDQSTGGQKSQDQDKEHAEQFLDAFERDQKNIQPPQGSGKGREEHVAKDW